MTKETFYQLLQGRIEERLRLLQVKGQAYSGTEDVFANFIRNADRMNMSKYQVWLVYFCKHIDAITNGIKANPLFPYDQSEGMVSRIDDAINYLDLLSGMLAEDKTLRKDQPPPIPVAHLTQ